MTPVYNLSAPISTAPGSGLSDFFSRAARLDTRILVWLRCVLAFSAFAVTLLAVSESRHWGEWVYGSLAIYCVFSTYLAYYSWRYDWQPSHKAMHWIDVAFYGFLIGVTGGSESVFFLFFFYPILASSFSWGVREGLLVTIVSTTLFIGSEFVISSTAAPGRIGANDSLIYASYLFVFGYMISYLGGHERLLTRRLALLKEINNPWNPRFGVDHVNGVNLDRLREFYNGASCVLILRRPTLPPQYVMHVSSRDKPGYSRTPTKVEEKAAEALLRLPDSLAAYYHDPDGPFWLRYRGYSGYDFDQKVRTKAFKDECEGWTNLLDAKAFVTVPYSQHDGSTGRLFLTSDSGGFTHSDIEFLVQVSDTMATVIENVYLVEELISKAAEHQRLAISRDLHDTTIQPYIGLKLALDALYREAGDDNAISPRISEIISMTEMTVRDLRSYAATFKEKIPMPGEFLVEAVKHQAERLERFYGITVGLTSYISPLLSGRLAGEAFQIISEGLSNVLRHSQAKNAFVAILCENSELLLQIGNELVAGVPDPGKFTPRSISERAQALKGKTLIERRSDGYTVVHVTIPM
jgi:signal transduction histidine kinase